MLRRCMLLAPDLLSISAGHDSGINESYVGARSWFNSFESDTEARVTAQRFKRYLIIILRTGVRIVGKIEEHLGD
jgi:hypothetical protein